MSVVVTLRRSTPGGATLACAWTGSMGYGIGTVHPGLEDCVAVHGDSIDAVKASGNNEYRAGSVGPLERREERGRKEKRPETASTHKNKGGKTRLFRLEFTSDATTLGHWLEYMKELAISNVKTEQNEVNWDKETDFYERSRSAHLTASERAFEEGIAEECGLWHSAERDVVE
ncbi:hypothetical protein BGY98DRAFT_1177408 [Russula aff. rugulosa BPL654]|nr:hypothetical protein BGY98DRAFT_1177408 [Russula aff. rugulosa BPL654]